MDKRISLRLSIEDYKKITKRIQEIYNETNIKITVSEYIRSLIK